MNIYISNISHTTCVQIFKYTETRHNVYACGNFLLAYKMLIFITVYYYIREGNNNDDCGYMADIYDVLSKWLILCKYLYICKNSKFTHY